MMSVPLGFLFIGLRFRQSSFHHMRLALINQAAIAATVSTFCRHAMVPCRISPVAAVTSQGKSVGTGNSQLTR